MTGPLIAAAFAALAVAVLTRRRTVGDRLNAALAAPPAPGGQLEVATAGESKRRGLVRVAVAMMTVIAGPVVMGGSTGVVVGLMAGIAVALVRPPRRARAVDPDDLAVVIDLVAGCLAGGTGLPAALDAASVAAEAQLRDRCRAVAGALRSGLPADEAWRPWLADPWLAPVARTAVRTSHTGAGAAADLRRTSARLRARRRSAAQHKVRQASVWLVVPLGLCFLPAFVLVAVVPLVVGLIPTLR